VDLPLHGVELVVEPCACAPIFDGPVRALLLEQGNGRFMLQLQSVTADYQTGEFAIAHRHAAPSMARCAPGGP
jgi:hypothetical protein